MDTGIERPRTVLPPRRSSAPPPLPHTNPAIPSSPAYQVPASVEWDTEFLLQADDLEWSSRIVVEGFLQGLHRSPLRGFSSEFAEHKPYSQGDDLRFLDWQALARTDRLYVRQYEAETNLRAQIIVDASGSMGFKSSKGHTKYQYCALLAATLSRVLLRQNDACGLTILQESEPAAHLPPRLGKRHFDQALAALTRTHPHGGTAVGSHLATAARHLRRRALIVILSDIWEDPENYRQPFREFAARHHEIHLWQILDPSELDLSLDRGAILQDLETGLQLPVDPKAMRKLYLERLAAHQNHIAAICFESGVALDSLTTATLPYDALRRLLHRREHRT